MRWVVAAVVLGCLLGGCTTVGSESAADPAPFASLTPGRSTKAQVFERVGQPHDVAYLPSGESVWSYYRVSTRVNAMSLIPVVGWVAAGNDTDVNVASVFFDDRQSYEKVEVTAHSAYQNSWAGLAKIASQHGEKARVEAEMKKVGLAFDAKLASEMETAIESLK
ncbi:putative Lipoprotein [uncultured Defluviicoccus sp.]|uniref:Putative Lipoprotein n=1 Tax=metagenome TaxID=256318 RepID=A0A380T7H5_9ZZZZ|nr:putative Lipoprotein [uncultured Defluviicoccus sp.]